MSVVVDAASVPYEIIADCFRDRTVVPFLGSAASFVGAEGGGALPSGAELAKLLVGNSEQYPGPLSDPLTKVAQYVQEVPADREYLLGKIARRFDADVRTAYTTSVARFLATIQSPLLPPLIVTTNYDTLVERALDGRDIPYLAISHIFNSKYAGRLICYESLKTPLELSNVRTLTQVQEQLLDFEQHDRMPILVYKMHGTARIKCQGSGTTLDSIVLTENDYVDFFAQDMLRSIPSKIVDTIRRSRLLFLGYALEDWNFRVLLRKVQLLQRRDKDTAHRHWAFLLNADSVESKFWDRRGVNLYGLSLDVFLQTLTPLLAAP